MAAMVKNGILSNKFKERGNASFRQKQFQEAIVNYNKGLCNAENNLQLSFLYANRATAYLEVKRYKECLENIELAKKFGYPEDKMTKLMVREVMCKNLMASADEKNIKNDTEEAANNFFKLSYESHSRIPFIIDGIECKKNDRFGRHLITTRDLKPGDIIAIEDPFLKLMDKESEIRYERCSVCLKHNNLNLLPCEKCSEIMYCSAECVTKDQYHQYLSCGTVSDPLRIRYEAAMSISSDKIPKEPPFDVQTKYLENWASEKTIFDFNFDSLDEDKKLEKKKTLDNVITKHID